VVLATAGLAASHLVSSWRAISETSAGCKRPALQLWCVSSLSQLHSTDHEKIPARNSIYAHGQDFAMSDDLLLAILKALFSCSLWTVNLETRIPISKFHRTAELIQRDINEVKSFIIREISGSHDGEHEMITCCHITPCSLVEVYRRFRGALSHKTILG
jgi:hypothetical protein